MFRWLCQHLMRLSADLAEGADVQWERGIPFAKWPDFEAPAYCPRGFVFPVFEGSWCFVDYRMALA